MRKKYLILSVACSIVSAAVILLAAWLPSKYEMPVLMYHSVSPTWFEPLNNVQPQHFARQMAFIKEQGYQVIAVDEYVRQRLAGSWQGRKSVVLTFDDGYDNNYSQAFPLLMKYGFPATIFLEVGHLGKPGHLTWDHVREMGSAGVSFQSHLMTGAYLPELTHNEAVQEVVQSKIILEEKLGRPVLFLAYPVGGFNQDTKNILKSSGYKAAFTTNRGSIGDPDFIYGIRRIRVKDTDSDNQLRLKLSGYYNLFRSPRNPF